MQDRIKKLIISTLLKGESIYEVSLKWNDENKKYDAMPKETAPQRYTNFYVHDDTITYHHINRQYAFSPDGWGMLIVEEPLNVTG
jgi:hypothetical protein